MNNSGILSTNKEQKLLLTSISKKGLFFIFIVFGMMVTISLFVSFNAPKPWSSFEQSTWRCAGNDSEFNKNCGGVNLFNKEKMISVQLGPYSIFNQETRLEFYMKKKAEKKGVQVDGNIMLKYTVFGTQLLNKFNQTVPVKSLYMLEEKIVNAHVHCKKSKDVCEPNHINTQLYLDYPLYIVDISIISEDVHDSLGDMVLKTTYVSLVYTVFEMFWRLVFIIFSCLCTIIYMWANRSIVQDNWSHEQKWTIVLLTFLIWENNPLYPYEFLMDNAFYLFVNSVIDAVFICFLMFYILIMFDALRKPVRQRNTFRFYFPRALLCLTLFSLILASFMYNKTRKVYSPTMKGTNDVVNVIISISIMVLLGIYLFWLFFSIIRSLSEVRKLGTAGYRVKIYGLFTIVVLILYVVLLLIAFFKGYRNNAAVSLTTIAYVNFYCMVLTILYLPSSSQEQKVERAKIVKLDEDDIELKVEDYDVEDTQNAETNDVVLIDN